MAYVPEITAQMKKVAPAGANSLSTGQTAQLQLLTSELSAASPGAVAEYERFMSVKDRALTLPEDAVSEHLTGAVVLVTGGTGCIGSALLRQLAEYAPRRLVSISRGITSGTRQDYIEYLSADVRDEHNLRSIMSDVRPDIVFHTAAQRSPSLAEVEVHRTASTNTLGTRNVLRAAAAVSVPQVVCASTGKALRPYSPEVYTASKRAAEWVSAQVAAEGNMLVSACRFTHVVDNSIICDLLSKWSQNDDVIRLHSADTVFYVQSAQESAQLLLAAMLNAKHGEFRISAITDLGWPVSLLDLALGARARSNSCSPVYFSGYEPGYEEVPYPGLYDPMTAGDVSPLMNAMETAAMVPSQCGNVDAFHLDFAPSNRAQYALQELERACTLLPSDGNVRTALDELSWMLLDDALLMTREKTAARIANLTRQHGELLPVHARILAAVNHRVTAVNM